MKINEQMELGIISAVLNNGETILTYNINDYKEDWLLEMKILNTVATGFYGRKIETIHYECNSRTKLLLKINGWNLDLEEVK
ncbi:MAG: hypothetical protein ACRCX2_22185 [Paraclostridium sp.]